MKSPRLNELKFDEKGTKEIREAMKKTKKVKITINIDQDSLIELRKLAIKNGGSYQKLLNKILKDKLFEEGSSEDRLDRLEKEIEKIKKKLAA